jgi:hypothetical protein
MSCMAHGKPAVVYTWAGNRVSLNAEFANHTLPVADGRQVTGRIWHAAALAKCLPWSCTISIVQAWGPRSSSQQQVRSQHTGTAAWSCRIVLWHQQLQRWPRRPYGKRKASLGQPHPGQLRPKPRRAKQRLAAAQQALRCHRPRSQLSSSNNSSHRQSRLSRPCLLTTSTSSKVASSSAPRPAQQLA